MKKDRHSAIFEIIEQHDIETQEELAEVLRDSGIRVTQATVSRDIKELRLLKVLTEKGTYKYATVDKAKKGLTERFMRIFAETVLSMADSFNLIIVKTLSGSAHVAGEAIDNLHWPEIVGTLAGDNTVLVIVKDPADVPHVMEQFRIMMK